MKNVLTSAEARSAEKTTIEATGIQSGILMERAGLETVNFIFSEYPDIKSALVMAGPGNNGGDGLCVARVLSEKGVSVDVFYLGSNKTSEGFNRERAILENINSQFNDPVGSVSSITGNYDIFVDALFGTGFNREADSTIEGVIDLINSFDVPVVSVDIPSGLDSDTGLPRPCAVRADLTVSLGSYKKGQFLNDGPEYCGKLVFADIGLWYRLPDDSMLMLETEDICGYLPTSSLKAHKGTYGKCLIIAGNSDIYGAAYLSSKAALYCGAGMVKVITSEKNRQVLQEKVPEALFYFYDDAIDIPKVNESMEWADTILIGPGIGTGDLAFSLLKTLIEFDDLSSKYLIFDADALNLFAQNKDLFNKFIFKAEGGKFKAVFTPHKGELNRLKNSLGDDIVEKCFDKGIVFVLKDAKTIVTADHPYINNSGNDGMATAGSGDVLAGILCGMLFRMKEYPDFSKNVAVCVYIHGLCGDSAALCKGKISMTAADILENIPNVFKRLIS